MCGGCNLTLISLSIVYPLIDKIILVDYLTKDKGIGRIGVLKSIEVSIVDNWDEFEATMLDAGWATDEIEEMWLKHSQVEYDNDTWPTEEWDRD
jgi:hypothetical protein